MENIANTRPIFEDFAHVHTWVFDLDNTLYPPKARLFDQIEAHMVTYMVDTLKISEAKANEMRTAYWHDHGTTLAGLMHHHDIDPDPFLEAVHDISMHPLTPDPTLAGRIGALPGRRIVYTNGTAPYARRVIAARGLDGLFDAVYGVEHANYRPKPEASAFQQVFGQDGLDPTHAAMFEDEARNLAVPHDLGMRTIHVAPERLDHGYIHHHTDNLSAFLARLMG